MANYISKVTLADGSVVLIKDAEARAMLSGAVHFVGITESILSDGAIDYPVIIDGSPYWQSNGDIVIYGSKEFIWAESNSEWHEMGDTSQLGRLAYKNSASGIVTSIGTVSKPDIDMTVTNATIKEIDTNGTVTAGTAASCTLPELSCTYDPTANDLMIGFTTGSFTPNQPTSVTLPTTKQTTVVTDVSGELHEDPVFTGENVQVVVT